MGRLIQASIKPTRWGAEAFTLVAHAKVLSGNKLEQLVVRLQRHSGRPKQECWRFVIQHGLKNGVDHRRWTEEEIEFVREELVNRSVEDIAKKLNRTPRAIRSMLMRNHLGLRDIRCDRFSIQSLAHALRVRTDEIHFWIEQNWLQATISIKGKRRSCLSQYGHRDRTRGRLRQRHCFEHGFPLIRSLRGSAQRSTSVLFSFVLSFDCGRIIHHPTIKNELRLPLELSKPQQRKVAESESR